MNDDILKLENQLCFPFYAVSRLITKLYQPYLAELDLTYPQYLALLVLWERDKRTVTEIGTCLLLETNTLTPLLKRLEEKQLIKRTRSSTDERQLIIELTDMGRAFQAKAKTIPSEIVKKIHLPNKSHEDFIELKKNLLEIIEAIK